MTMLELTSGTNGVLLRLKVVPGSSRDRIVGDLGGALKITVAAPPEKGKANKAVVHILAKALGLRDSQVEVTGGASTPNKTVLIRGARPERIQTLAGGR
jgi:uncharacterized protein